MASESNTLAQKLAALTAQVETLNTRRAEAAAVYKLAQKQLDDIDAAIRALGFDPEMSDEALAALEQQLDAEMSTAQRLMQQEEEGLAAVMSAAKVAGLV